MVYELSTRRLLLVSGVLALCATPRGAIAEIIPPELVQAVEAEVPPEHRFTRVEVELWITLDDTGLVTDVELARSAGEPFDSAAVAAVQRFQFTPAIEDGVPIPVRVPFVYRFQPPPRRGRFVPARRRRAPPERTPGYRFAAELLEKGTRSPLGGILVVLRDPATGKETEVTTEADGIFRAYGLPPGEVELEVATGEHATLKRTVRTTPPPPEGEEAPPEPSITLYLDPVGVPRYRTVVRDKPPAQAATEIGLTEDELRRTPGTLGDPTRVVALLPGVARSPFGLGYYVVRGASFENTGFFIDGHPALFLYHLLGGPGVIHPELVGKLTFYPGGYPTRFGRFATGAIVLETKDPPDDRWHGDVSVDLLKASMLFSVPLDDKRALISATVRRSYYELIIPLITDDFGLSYTDYQVRASWSPTSRLRTRFLALGAEDRVAATAESGSETGLAIGFHRVMAAVDYDATPEVTLTNSVAWEYDHNSSQRSAEGDDTIDVDVSGWFLSLKSAVEFKPLEGVSFEGGVDAMIVNSSWALRVPSFPPLGDPRPPIFDPTIVTADIQGDYYSVAPYVSLDWDVGGGVRLIPGVRAVMDYYGDGARWEADPRLAIRWQVHPQWTITAMGAMAHQPAAVFQVAEEVGDPTLPDIRGVQASLGLEWEPGDGWEVKVEGFFNYLDNMARPSGAVESDGGNFNRAYWTADMEGRAVGLEVMIRKRFGGRFYGWLSYTLSRAERLRPPNDWELFELDQTHILNLAWTVQLGADWSLGARFTLTSGNPYFPIQGARYDADRDRYEPIYAEERDRLQVFHRLDVRLDKRWRFDTWMIEAYLDIQNVYNASNPESRRYSFDYTVETDGASVPILPTLGVRGVF